MFIHFKKERPFHKHCYSYINKLGAEIGSGKLASFSQKISVFEGSCGTERFTVDIINAPEKNKATADPRVSGREVAKFSFAQGERGNIQWMFKETGKKGFLGIKKRYYWWEIKISGKSYQMYRVGLGNNGYYYQLNQGDTVVAMIEKEIVVIDFCDEYDIYIDDAAAEKAALAAVAYIDLSFHNHYLEETARGKEKIIEITKLPEVLEKYDPNFIPRMRKQEGM